MSASLPDGFYFKRLNEEDTNEVCQFLSKFYIGKDNHMSLIRGMTDEDIISYNNARVTYRLKQPYSAGIFEKPTDILVAVTLGFVREKESTPDHGVEKNKTSELNPVQLALNFASTLEGDIYDRLKVEKVFEKGMRVTHSDYKNRGFSNLLDRVVCHFGTQSGCKYIITKSTNEYVCRNFEKNFPDAILDEIKYADYVDPITGANPFIDPKHPYVRAILTVRAVDGLKELDPIILNSFK